MEEERKDDFLQETTSGTPVVSAPEPSAEPETRVAPPSADGIPLLEKVCNYARRGSGIQIATLAAIVMLFAFLISAMVGKGALSGRNLYWWLLGYVGIAIALIVGFYFVPCNHPEKVFARRLSMSNRMIAGLGSKKAMAKYAAAKAGEEVQERTSWFTVFVPMVSVLFLGAIFSLMRSPNEIIKAPAIGAASILAAIFLLLFTLQEANNRTVRQLVVKYCGCYNERKELAEWQAYRANKAQNIKSEKIWVATKAESVVAGVAAFLMILGFILVPIIMAPTSTVYARTVPVGKRVDNLEEYLGAPDAQEGNEWEYYSRKYRKLYEKYAKTEKDMANALENNDAEAFEKAVEKNMELSEKLSKMPHKVLHIKFLQDNTIDEVIFDTNYTRGVALSKTIKRQELQGAPTVSESDDLNTKKIYIKQYFTDGSFKYYALPSYVLMKIKLTEKGSQKIEWEDEWSEYSIFITVV